MRAGCLRTRSGTDALRLGSENDPASWCWSSADNPGVPVRHPPPRRSALRGDRGPNNATTADHSLLSLSQCHQLHRERYSRS
ncbi:unnamed protein product [Leptidea sinapis]|uniref:Uncharacterized protein n=1 Tax=Leptidea sinapis TaxID=189913 RepID=A0A5E4R318_9NEOP|nr:unnamed protein product [Leptidea sinapis]